MKEPKQSTKFTYKVINKRGKLEPWSGIFDNFAESQEWYNTHGKAFERQGYKLKLAPNKHNSHFNKNYEPIGIKHNHLVTVFDKKRVREDLKIKEAESGRETAS